MSTLIDASVLRATTLACAALAALLVAHALAAVPLSSPPRLGALGAQRRRALARSGTLRALAPLLSLIAAWVSEARRATPGFAAFCLVKGSPGKAPGNGPAGQSCSCNTVRDARYFVHYQLTGCHGL